MTEKIEILRNARAALKRGEITRQQYNDVRLMVRRYEIEKKILGKYPETRKP